MSDSSSEPSQSESPPKVTSDPATNPQTAGAAAIPLAVPPASPVSHPLPFGPSQFPPVAAGQMPQMAGLMIQARIGNQQNPEVMRHVTDFLKTDSNNKLSAHESRGKRSHYSV